MPSEEKPPILENEDIGDFRDLDPSADTVVMDERAMQSLVTKQESGVETIVNKPIDIPMPSGPAPGLDSNTGPFIRSVGPDGVSIFSESLRSRSTANKRTLLKSGGGSDASEAAVVRGLLWLVKKQRSNGSWVFDGGSADEVIAATGLALLPFAAAGHTHKKPLEKRSAIEQNFHQTVLKGVNFLISAQQANGSFTGAKTMYAHGIATVALCELFGMSGDKARLLVPAAKASAYCSATQGANGSWGYGPNANGDTSIVGWLVQGVHSAKLCREIAVPKPTLDKSRQFLDTVCDISKKHTYGYADRSPSQTLTPVGLLCRYYVDGWGPNNPSMAAGVQYLMKFQPSKSAFNMYYLYYATQVVHFYDGPEWKLWNEGDPKDKSKTPGIRDLLIDLQMPQDKAQAGSWNPDAGIIGGSCGRLGTTCLCLLTLEVYYRHLPLYKRDANAMRAAERDQ